jgi:hypothetical protein
MAPVAWACWENGETRDWPTLRAMSIAFPFAETAIGWILEYDIDNLEVCIELPFYNQNAKTLMLQMSLFDMLCSYTFDYLRPHTERLWLTTMHNATSKRALAHDGKATKQQMVAASPWSDFKAKGLTFLQAHTLADAYAHSLSAGQEEYPLHALEQYSVEWTVRHPDEDS